MMKSFIVEKSGKLSKIALNSIDDLSYTALMKSFRKKDVKVNGKRVSVDVNVNQGDKVEIYYVATTSQAYSLIFCDQNVLVVNKKVGFTAESVYQNILESYPTAKFIHRLDRNTSGIMIFALNESAETQLLLGFKNRVFDKKYHALVKGIPVKHQAEISAYLLKDAVEGKVKIFSKAVKGASLIKTAYKVIRQDDKTSLLEVGLITGKTHQIRAHLAFIGHPIVGDSKYGNFDFNSKFNYKHQQLSAVSLTLNFDKDSSLYYLNGKQFIIESDF